MSTKIQIPEKAVVQAAFIGGAVGDAAGLATEGMGRQQIHAQYKSLMTHDAALNGWQFSDFVPSEIFSRLNKHPHGVIAATRKIENSDGSLAGQYGVYTDDTSQLFAVTESIIDYKGEMNRLDIARRLHQWAYENGIGMGRNFFNAVSHDDFLSNPHAAAFDYLESMNFVPAANGAIMRSAPLGTLCLAPASQADFHFKVADIAALTHANPRCILASVFAASLVAGILQGNTGRLLVDYSLEKSHDVYLRTYEADAPWTIGIKNYKGRCVPRQWEAAYTELLQIVESIWSSDSLASLADIEPDCGMDNFGNAPIGYTYLPIKLLAASLKLKLTFDAAVLQIISLGGDTDTNACVVGAVLAALQPSNPKLSPWLQKILPVQKERIIDTAQRFYEVVSAR